MALIGVGAVFLLRETSTFTPPRMAGSPLVTARNETATILVLTSHQETTDSLLRKMQGGEVEPPILHWDLWAFDARDLRRRWVTRLGSVRRGQHEPDRGILGAESGAVWVLVNRLVLVSQNGGRILGDGPMIEARNEALRSGLSSSRQAFTFDRGLLVAATTGTQLRIDPRSLTALPLAMATRANESVLPLMPLPAGEVSKRRSAQLGMDWVGLATNEERHAWEHGGDVASQDLSQARRYRLTRARAVDRRDDTGTTTRRLRDFTAIAGSPDFLNGGLLVLDNQRGGYNTVILSEPRRFLVLHQDAPGDNAGQLLSCIHLTGATCWQATLGLRSITGGLPIGEGAPSTWATLLFGRGVAADGPYDEADAIVRVGLQEGTVTQLNISGLSVSDLATE